MRLWHQALHLGKKKKNQSLPHIMCRNNSYLIKKLDIKDKSRKHWKLQSDVTLSEVILKSCNIRTIVSSGDRRNLKFPPHRVEQLLRNRVISKLADHVNWDGISVHFSTAMALQPAGKKDPPSFVMTQHPMQLPPSSQILIISLAANVHYYYLTVQFKIYLNILKYILIS